MKHDFPKMGMEKLCGLFGKTRVAIYDYQKRLQSDDLQDEVILYYVKEVRGILPRLGTRKLHIKIKPKLAQHGITIGCNYLFELLAQYHLLIRQRKRKVITTNSRHWMHKYANKITELLVTRSEQLWVSDITFIRLNNQWGYLSLITDAYSRKIMGYCFRMDMSARGCMEALQMALNNRQYTNEPLIHHSDRGSQYCCRQYVELLTINNITISMTENGDPYENALAERMNGIIKSEFNLYESSMGFENTYEKIRTSIKAYNEERPHSSCNMLTPQQAHLCTGILQKKWKKYPAASSTQSSKKEAAAAPFTEQGDASFFTENTYPLSLNERCIAD